jgi:hypothetical protein
VPYFLLGHFEGGFESETESKGVGMVEFTEKNKQRHRERNRQSNDVVISSS